MTFSSGATENACDWPGLPVLWLPRLSLSPNRIPESTKSALKYAEALGVEDRLAARLRKTGHDHLD